MKTRSRLGMLVALIVATSSSSVCAKPTVSSTWPTLARELMAADRAFGKASAKHPGLDGLAAAFAEDVILPLPGRGFADGKSEVIAALRAGPASETARFEWAPVRVGISADGSQGFSFGFLDQHRADGVSLPFKYLAYWQRKCEGWKIIAWKQVRSGDGKARRQAMAPLLPGNFAAATVQPALDAAEQAFSDEAQTVGLGPAFVKYGTDDSMNLAGSATAGFVFGAEAIAKLVGEGEPASGSRFSWAADVRTVVADSGDLGLSVGHIRINQRNTDGSEAPAIPFFTVWRRAAADQPWRYVAE